MKIAVFIDFSEGSKMVLGQAVALAQRHNGNVMAINIVDSGEKKDETMRSLKSFVSGEHEKGIPIECTVGVGDLFVEAKRILVLFSPDYVFVCTHGVKGVKQNLFGAFIVKLVQSIPFPCIVFQENNKVDLTTAKNILFPIGIHEHFEFKTEEAIRMAKLMGGKIYTYYIDKPSLGEESQKMANLKSAIKRFEAEHITYEMVKEDLEFFSAGYSKQTLNYCRSHSVDLIIIMATVSVIDDFMNEADKEQFLVNDIGIPVFCCNI